MPAAPTPAAQGAPACAPRLSAPASCWAGEEAEVRESSVQLLQLLACVESLSLLDSGSLKRVPSVPSGHQEPPAPSSDWTEPPGPPPAPVCAATLRGPSRPHMREGLCAFFRPAL